MQPVVGTIVKNSSFQSLKSAKQQHNKQMRMRSRKMKKQKFLKQQIYKNHNIFHTLSNVNHFHKSMSAQNIIWTKNYQLKESINKLKEENSSLKARIWNVEKENRKMDRQIQTWGLKKVYSNSSTKPYIDTATAEKVLADQDYSITSIKILIVELQHELQLLSEELEQGLSVNRNIKHLKSDMMYEIGRKKVEMYKSYIFDEEKQSQDKDELERILEEKRELLMSKKQELQFVAKNLSIKQRSRRMLEEELSKLQQKVQGFGQISAEKISALKLETNKLRTEDESYVNEEMKKVANVQQKYLQFECKLQDRMGDFIKRKIELNKQISSYEQKINNINKWQETMSKSPQQQKVRIKQKRISHR